MYISYMYERMYMYMFIKHVCTIEHFRRSLHVIDARYDFDDVVVDRSVHREEVLRLRLHSTRALLARPHAARRVPTTSRRQGEADAEG